MTLSKEQAQQLFAHYEQGTADEAAAGERAEDHFTRDELRLAAIFKFTFHMAAIAHADGHPWENDVLEQKVAKIYNVDRADVRAALAMFTEHVPLQDWIAAAIDKHKLHRQMRTRGKTSFQQVQA